MFNIDNDYDITSITCSGFANRQEIKELNRLHSLDGNGYAVQIEISLETTLEYIVVFDLNKR